MFKRPNKKTASLYTLSDIRRRLKIQQSLGNSERVVELKILREMKLRGIGSPLDEIS